MKIVLIYSIDEFINYKKFVNENELERFINDENEYKQNFEVLECFEVSNSYEVEAVEYVVRYNVNKNK